MIVCQCNVLSDDTLAEAVADMRQSPDPVVITPGQVFRSCGCRFRCGSCMPLITSVIAKSYAAIAADPAHCDEPPAAAYSAPAETEALDHEGRQEGSGIPQQGAAA